jgi:hypothetical protein
MTDAVVQTFSKIMDIFLAYGLSGAVSVILLFACRNLFNRYCDVQEKRIAEAAAQTAALNANTNALNRIADAFRQGARQNT